MSSMKFTANKLPIPNAGWETDRHRKHVTGSRLRTGEQRNFWLGFQAARHWPSERKSC